MLHNLSSCYSFATFCSNESISNRSNNRILLKGTGNYSFKVKGNWEGMWIRKRWFKEERVIVRMEWTSEINVLES